MMAGNEKRPLITPTIGRVVWYYPFGADTREGSPVQPVPALIAYVHNDRHINIGGFNEDGTPLNATSVYLYHGDDDPRPVNGGFAEWMPYQTGQARKHSIDVEAVIAELQAKVEATLVQVEQFLKSWSAASIAKDVNELLGDPRQGTGAQQPAHPATSSLEMTDKQSAAVQQTPSRMTLQALKDRVVDIQYRRPVQAPHATVCEILLDNGYFLVGVSAPADPANFNEALGQQYAYEDAMRKLWPIQGFMLVENLFRSKLLRTGSSDPREDTGE